MWVLSASVDSRYGYLLEPRKRQGLKQIQEQELRLGSPGKGEARLEGKPRSCEVLTS